MVWERGKNWMRASRWGGESCEERVRGHSWVPKILQEQKHRHGQGETVIGAQCWWPGALAGGFGPGCAPQPKSLRENAGASNLTGKKQIFMHGWGKQLKRGEENKQTGINQLNNFCSKSSRCQLPLALPALLPFPGLLFLASVSSLAKNSPWD